MSKLSFLSLFTTLAISIGAASLHAAVPQLSVSPSSGSGQSQTFTVTATDADGAADIANVGFLINSVFDGESGCWLSWNNDAHAAYFNTDGYNWIYLPSGTTLENSRCAVQFMSSNTSGNTVNVSYKVTFRTPLSGPRNLWAEAINENPAGPSSYQQVGTWTVPASAPAPDFQVSITPSSMTIMPGTPETFSVAVMSLNGYSGNVQLSASPQVGLPGLTVSTWGTSGTSIFVPAGGVGVGTIQASASANTPAGDITIVANLSDGTLQHTATATLGIGSLPPTNPPAVSVTQTNIIGPLESFVVTVTDRNGYAAINGVNLLINSTLDGQNACWLNYTPGSNGGGTLSLASDDASTWTSMPLPMDPSLPQVQNTQCTTGGGISSVSGSGNTLRLTIVLTLSPALRGSLTMYARAGDADGDSGYQNMGAFSLSGGTGPDFTISDTPGTQTITVGSQATWQVTIDPRDNYAGTPNISVTGLPPDATLNGAPASVAAGKSTTFSVATAADTAAGTYPLTITATDGVLTHTAGITLVVQNAGLPVLSGVYDPTTANTPVTLHYAATSPSGPAPDSLNVLIANSVDGRHACWLSYYNGQLALASDDASSWLAVDSNGNAANSQCSVQLISTDSESGKTGIWVNIHPLGQFTATNKNIYLAASNPAGSTGYQLMGSWQMQ